MSIRIPLRTVLSVDEGLTATGPASTAGGVANAFLLPQDCDNVVVKYTASIVGGGASLIFQTSDDGGSTWWDVQRTSIISNGTSVLAEWLSIPVATLGLRTGVIAPSVVATGSVQSFGSVLQTIGRASASALGQREVSGLPILGLNARTFRVYTSAVTSIHSESIRVSANSQDAGN
mgnify:FL=1